MKKYLNSTIISLLGILPFNTYAQDNLAMKSEEIVEQSSKRIIKPTLEEITTLLSLHHSKILEEGIKNWGIKKFEYKNKSSPEELHKFLRENFKNKILLTYVNGDDQTQNKNKWAVNTSDESLSAGGAIGFLYASFNLNNNQNIGFLFIELRDFLGDWNRFSKLFNIEPKSLGFPFIAEFKRNSNGDYIFAELALCSTKTPDKIYKNIDLLVDEYSKK